jgi:hypothetical protein
LTIEDQEVSAQSEWNAITKERETGEPAAEKPPETSVEVAPEVDPLAELRAMIEGIDHRTKSAEGRIGALDKTLRESMQAATKAAMQQVTNAPTQARVNEAMKTPAGWEQLRAEHPDFVRIQEEFLDARLAHEKVNQLDQAAIDKIVSERVAGDTASVRAELIDAHLDAIVDGDWRAIAASPEFAKWREGQTAEVNALGASDKMSDSAKLLRLYQHAKIENPAADIIAARKNKLANAASTPRGIRVPPVKSEADMTDAEIWALESKRRDVARAKRT